MKSHLGRSKLVAWQQFYSSYLWLWPWLWLRLSCSQTQHRSFSHKLGPRFLFTPASISFSILCFAGQFSALSHTSHFFLALPMEGVPLVALKSLPFISDKCKSDMLSQAMSAWSLGASHGRATLSPCPSPASAHISAGCMLHSCRPAFRILSPQCIQTQHGHWAFLHPACLQGAQGRASILQASG